MIEIKKNIVNVSLLEYDEISGLLLIREITKDKAFYANRYLSVGNELVLRVIKVIPERKFISLSKIRVNPEEREKCKNKYNRAKIVYGICKLLSVKVNKPLLYLYQNIVWPLNKEHNKAYHIFKILAEGNNHERIMKKLEINEKIKEELINIIKIRFETKSIKIRSVIKLTCYNFYGIDAIKESLLNGEKIGTEKLPIKFKIIGSPLYECIINTVDKYRNDGIILMDQALLEVQNNIENRGGTFELCTTPCIKGESEIDICELMKKAKENS